MLTEKQNLLETIKGGSPDRFVNQFAYMEQFWADPVHAPFPSCEELGPGAITKDGWGITWSWPEGTPGAFPLHDQEHKVLKDITQWEKVVKAPPLKYPEDHWEKFLPDVQAVNRNEKFVAWGCFPGIFETLHSLMGVDDCLLGFYEEPEALHELIDYITEHMCAYADLICSHYHPDALYHHDDWGSQISSFFSPEMFRQFLVEPYKKLYGRWRKNGVELIVHHSDSYAANLVPDMIDIGIDIWQGCLSTNNIQELIKKYGHRISFMGDLNNGLLDVPDWDAKTIEKEVRRACTENGKHFFIPNLTLGGSMSTFPGVYECVSQCIDKMSKELF